MLYDPNNNALFYDEERARKLWQERKSSNNFRLFFYPRFTTDQRIIYSWLKKKSKAPKTEVENLLQDYLNYLEIEKNRSPKTSENYQHYLKEFLKFAQITSAAQITDTVVREFRLMLARRDIKRVTQAYYVIALRNFLKYLAKRDITSLSAPRSSSPKTPGRQIDTLEYNDLVRLLAAPKGQSLRDLRDKAILEMFFSHGIALGRGSVPSAVTPDLKGGELSVRGKGDKLRVVFISDTAREAVKKIFGQTTATRKRKLFISIGRTGK